jgi:DNA helicase-4
VDEPGLPDALYELADCLKHVTRDFEGTVRRLMASPSSGTAREQRCLRDLRTSLPQYDWERLPTLLRAELDRVNGPIRSRPGDGARPALPQRDRSPQERADLAARREDARRRLRDCLEHDYLAAPQLVADELAEWLSEDDLDAARASVVEAWAARRGHWSPDAAQAAAASPTGGHVLVTARAGSGKTAVLVNRAAFLIEHCGVPGDQILLLAFNRRAAEEIEQRISLLTSKPPPHVSTFHSLAYAVVQPDERIVYDEPEDPSPVLSRLVQQAIDDSCQDEVFLRRVRSVMMQFFRADLDSDQSRSLGASAQQNLAMRRSLRQLSLGGDRVKSQGEKVIANFLFERGIAYEYERSVRWGRRVYRPDFTIDLPGGGSVVLEYFGLAGDSAYDSERAQKRDYWSRTRTPLVELDRHELAGDLQRVEAVLHRKLERVMPVPPRQSDEEIWSRCRDHSILSISRSLRGFITRARQLGLAPQDLSELEIPPGSSGSPFLREYVRLGADTYQAYLDLLAAQSSEDFSGLVQRATARVRAGSTTFDRRGRAGDLAGIRFILIDEFQDFSTQFHQLVDAVTHAAPRAEVFAVGDDWQAINGFAGSDLTFFERFGDYYPAAEARHLTTNYRSTRPVVEAGNHLMVQLGVPAEAHNGGGTLIGWTDTQDVDLGASDLARLAGKPGQRRLAAVERVVQHSLGQGDTVHLLTRRTSDDGFLRLLRQTFPDARDRITASTVHKYKGRESDAVVLLDADANNFPLIHPEWAFQSIFGDSLADIVDAERRLLYVALTRARRYLHLLVDSRNPSPFLTGIRSSPWFQEIPWSTLAPIDSAAAANGATRVVVSGATFAVREALKAAKFRWEPETRTWWRHTSGPIADWRAEPWAATSADLEVSISRDGTTVRFHNRDRGRWHELRN